MKKLYITAVLLVTALMMTGCGSASGAKQFSISGVVSGLTGTITLQNNGADDLALVSDGIFTFSTLYSDHSFYSVTVKTTPAGESCTVQNSSGMITAASVTNISVTCIPSTAPADKLTSSDGGPGNEFGYGTAISSNGDTIAVAARHDHAAYIYKWDGTMWLETKLTGTYGFGTAASVSSDGNVIVVGAGTETITTNLNQGAAYVYKWDGAAWNAAKLTASDGASQDDFGTAAAVSGDGNTVIVGAYNAHYNGVNAPAAPGLAYVYKWDGAAWVETKISAGDAAPGDGFGSSVALSADGNTAVVGAPSDDVTASDQGSAYVYTWNGTGWDETKLYASDGGISGFFGGSVSVSADGTVVAAGASGVADKAYVYKKNGSSWTEFRIAPGDGPIEGFGQSVALSSDGTILAVGAIYVGAGSVYAYSWDGTSWGGERKMVDPAGKKMDCLGYSVAVTSDGSTIAAGAVPYLDAGGSGPGYVDIFR